MDSRQRDYPADTVWHLVRIYVFVFSALFILIIYTTGSLVRAVLLAVLVALPVSAVIWFVLNKLGSGTVNILYGMSDRERNIDPIRDGEITKLIPFKENKQYDTFQSGLRDIEEKYGQSPRLIYYRAVCHIELGDYGKARKCLAAFLKENDRKEYGENEFYRFCLNLYREDLPTKEALSRENDKQ